LSATGSQGAKSHRGVGTPRTGQAEIADTDRIQTIEKIVRLNRARSGAAIPRRIAFINEKGGSGKTTLVANIAAHLALERGRNVLAIDMDPQGQLGKVLGLEVRKPRASAIELLLDSVLGDSSRPEALDPAAASELPVSHTRIPGLDVVVSNKSLALFPSWGGPVGHEARDQARNQGSNQAQDPTQTGNLAPELRLAANLDAAPELDAYDFVLFDAPPSFGPLTVSVLLASEEVVVPVPLTYLAMDGFAELLQTISMVQSRYDHRKLRVSMVVPTFYRRTRLAHEILEKLTKRFPKEIAQTVVGYHVKIDEAQSHGLSIFEYAPKDRGARAMAALAEELEARGAEQQALGETLETPQTSRTKHRQPAQPTPLTQPERS
jgi:chromosome partitioning protein